MAATIYRIEVYKLDVDFHVISNAPAPQNICSLKLKPLKEYINFNLHEIFVLNEWLVIINYLR